MIPETKVDERAMFRQLAGAVAVVFATLAGVCAYAPLQDKPVLCGFSLAVSLIAAVIAVTGIGLPKPSPLPTDSPNYPGTA